MNASHPVTDRDHVLAYLSGSLDNEACEAFDRHLCECRSCRWDLRMSVDLQRWMQDGGDDLERRPVLERVREATRRHLVRCVRELLQCCLLARDDAAHDLLVPGRADDFEHVLEHARSLGRRLSGLGGMVDLSGLPGERPGTDQALDAARRVLAVLDELSGGDAWSDVARALVLRLDGESEAALASSRATLARCRDAQLSACAFVNLCTLLLEQGEVEQALATADANLEHDEDDVLALAVSLACLSALGRQRAARAMQVRFAHAERVRPSVLARRWVRGADARGARRPRDAQARGACGVPAAHGTMAMASADDALRA